MMTNWYIRISSIHSPRKIKHIITYFLLLVTKSLVIENLCLLQFKTRYFSAHFIKCYYQFFWLYLRKILIYTVPIKLEISFFFRFTPAINGEHSSSFLLLVPLSKSPSFKPSKAVILFRHLRTTRL